MTVVVPVLVVGAHAALGEDQRSSTPATLVLSTNAVSDLTPSGQEAVEFTVINNGERAVTAFEIDVDLECTYSDGSEKRQSLIRNNYKECAGLRVVTGAERA